MESITSQAKMVAGNAYQRLLTTFAAVPDDKLTWSPSATSHSALQIAAHCGFSNQFLAGRLSGEEMPVPANVEEMQEGIKKAIATITTRQQALDLLAGSIEKVNAVLDTVKPEALGTEVKTPFGQVTLGFLIFAPGIHMQTHAAQIDYIQTIYGDVDMHM